VTCRPPVGDLRLRAPVPYEGSHAEVNSATSYGAICPGFGISSTGYPLSEDCLTINVVRPEGVDQGADLPILFWIFGGGFVQGAAVSRFRKALWALES
jgi:carboxylesterase type B